MKSKSNDAKRPNPYTEALRDWWLGQVIKGHEIGPYRLVEYHPRITKGSTVTHEIDYSTSNFATFMEQGGEIIDTCRSYHSLDAALAGCIARRAEGCNHHADIYFIAALEALAKRGSDA